MKTLLFIAFVAISMTSCSKDNSLSPVGRPDLSQPGTTYVQDQPIEGRKDGKTPEDKRKSKHYAPKQ